MYISIFVYTTYIYYIYCVCVCVCVCVCMCVYVCVYDILSFHSFLRWTRQVGLTISLRPQTLVA